MINEQTQTAHSVIDQEIVKVPDRSPVEIAQPEAMTPEMGHNAEYPWKDQFYAEFVPTDQIESFLADLDSDARNVGLVIMDNVLRLESFDFVATKILAHQTELQLDEHPRPTLDDLFRTTVKTDPHLKEDFKQFLATAATNTETAVREELKRLGLS